MLAAILHQQGTLLQCLHTRSNHRNLCVVCQIDGRLNSSFAGVIGSETLNQCLRQLELLQRNLAQSLLRAGKRAKFIQRQPNSQGAEAFECRNQRSVLMGQNFG